MVAKETAQAVVKARLRIRLEDRLDAAVERLGDAYVAALAQEEAKPDIIAMGYTFAPLSAEALVEDYGIERWEAEAIVEIVAEEYKEQAD